MSPPASDISRIFFYNLLANLCNPEIIEIHARYLAESDKSFNPKIIISGNF